MSEAIPPVRTKTVRLSESIDPDVFYLEETMTIEEFIRQLGEKFVTIYPNAESVELMREDYDSSLLSNDVKFTVKGKVPIVPRPVIKELPRG